MKPCQFIFALFLTVSLESTCIVGYEWEPEADVEIPGNAAIHPPNGLRRVQATTDLSSTGLSTDTDSDTPTTIMVLLPDNLAASYSGSGSVMFFDGP
ncbi:hypothetical protein PInf_004088 [Phytophthora infestans]|nr:hypothetical protein PInf_004088 [Phytophthora infestans]